MGRVLAIDFGRKRVGLAVTDELRIIANGLQTVPAKEVLAFLKDYMSKEKVDRFVVGEARQLDNTLSESSKYIEPFVHRLRNEFPEIPIDRIDERFTSKMAFQAMIDGGLKKKSRRDKAMVDKISAVIILQSWLSLNESKY